jgi:single-strand DNA-binding protein
MYETTVTLQGYVGTDLTSRVAGESVLASFRVACTPRRYQRKTESWVDGPTQWYSVTAWRALADNCLRSLHRGDPVVVHGRLTVGSYVNRDGIEVNTLDVEATHVGHDLSRGTSVFTKTPKPAPAPEAARDEVAA